MQAQGSYKRDIKPVHKSPFPQPCCLGNQGACKRGLTMLKGMPGPALLSNHWTGVHGWVHTFPHDDLLALDFLLHNSSLSHLAVPEILQLTFLVLGFGWAGCIWMVIVSVFIISMQQALLATEYLGSDEAPSEAYISKNGTGRPSKKEPNMGVHNHRNASAQAHLGSLLACLTPVSSNHHMLLKLPQLPEFGIPVRLDVLLGQVGIPARLRGSRLGSAGIGETQPCAAALIELGVNGAGRCSYHLALPRPRW